VNASTALKAGLAAGVADITGAFVSGWLLSRATPVRILKYIASGLMGPAAFEGGAGVAALGLALHFVIALGAAAVYVFASTRLRALARQAVAAGVLYGVAVWAFMRFVVLPLSRVRLGPLRPLPVAVGILVHIVCVGLPIALLTRRDAVRA
jgi:hypothetical protein